MLLFGHSGITAGIFKMCDIVADGAISRYKPDCETAFNSGSINRRNRCLCRRILATIDYRLVLLGSMLPDIIDKPTWLFAFGDIFSTGRGYAHSFMFNLVLLLIALILLRYRKSWLLVISLSSIIHLVLDQIWNEPLTLWWPLIGPMPKVATTGWYAYLVEELISSPSVYIPEIIGLMVLVLMGARLVMKRRITHFFRTGVIE